MNVETGRREDLASNCRNDLQQGVLFYLPMQKLHGQLLYRNMRFVAWQPMRLRSTIPTISYRA